ncbi:MAG: peptide deformylase [Dysgonomonas sp.]|nr:peptide deformylase [Dysgonomonas sp.]
MTIQELALINDAKIDVPFRVLTVDNEEDSLVLRKKAMDIDVNTITTNKPLKYFIERLKQTLIEEAGVGIAAPQVGLSRNLFLFLRLDRPDYPICVAINPRIVNVPKETVCFEDDGCLSIPGESGTSIRYPWIEVEYYNEKGELIKEKLSGYSRNEDFTGIIFQHEFDHLQGVLFIDKLCEK